MLNDMLEVLLSSSHLLLVLLCSVLLGFGITLLTLHAYDSRVFDRHGRQVPGPGTASTAAATATPALLWARSLRSVLRQARSEHRLSWALKHVVIDQLGDGNVAAFNSFSRNYTLVVAHPEMVKAVLSGHHMKFPKPAALSRRLWPLLGRGLLTSSDLVWQMHRHMLNPGFQAEALRSMIDCFDKQARKLQAHWQRNIRRLTDGQKQQGQLLGQVGIHSIRVDLNNDISSLVLAALFYTTIGYDFQNSKNDPEATTEAMLRYTAEVQQRAADLEDWDSWRLLLDPLRRARFAASRQHLESLIDDAISSRLRVYGKGLHRKLQHTAADSLRSPSSDEADAERRRDKDLLDMLLRCSEGLSDDYRLARPEIRDHLLTFLVAGHEPVASSLLWCIYELCLHPEVQQRCHDEVDQLLICNGIHQNFVTFEDVNRLTYLVQVLKETMRLHPAVGHITRVCNTDCTVGDYKVSAGATVVVSCTAVHRHADFWQQPDKFLPERFSRENIRSTLRHAYQYVPFSAGPRSCIGQRYALMQLLTVLSSLLSQFSFSLTEEDQQRIREEERFTAQPVDFHVTVVQRRYATSST